MESTVKSVFVEKKEGFNVEAIGLLKDLKENLGLHQLEKVRILNRYNIEGLSESEYTAAIQSILSEPPVDYVLETHLQLQKKDKAFAVEFLPGQYDQRADSAAQCIQLLTQGERPIIGAAKVIILEGEITEEEVLKIKKYYINPVDSREASLDKPLSLLQETIVPPMVQKIENFIALTEDQLRELLKKSQLAMTFEDLKFCQRYFKEEEHRNPTITEIKVIDTYWSDHCRHTTFNTIIKEVEIENKKYTHTLQKAYQQYLEARKFVYGEKEKAVSLMDIAVIAMKELRKKGLLPDLDLSDEINACTIEKEITIDGKKEKWLILFKNETHNHPTEIEPFGGAATCLGGAIRDPLSGRAYVYQAMRVTGSGDPRAKIEETLPGKLPQRKISVEAAHGYSSYGNQIGLATGQVTEIYHQGYIAKRLEIGAVVGAVKKENVRRETPVEGDIVILVGGRTGRDGCGGATGSSKEHTEESIHTCGAEVQKGNAPEERKLQRLFRNPAASKLIKRCNDFGAGGVAVAVGELTEGIHIDLDAVPKKYLGLDGTEIAISESQERMAVVVEAKDAEEFILLAAKENLEATIIAKVSSDRRLKMKWKEEEIVDLSRDFLDTNGEKAYSEVKVTAPREEENYFKLSIQRSQPLKEKWLDTLKDLNICSQKGLVERFDSTIGAGSILMPFGGKYQFTPSEVMAAKIPTLKEETAAGTMMSYGFNPYLSSWSPFHGAIYSVIEAVSKIVASGGNYKSIRLTLQEYFEKLGQDPKKWGKPFSALLGALYAQRELNIAAIGGKDSMSGTFEDLSVPPTLVTFALDVVDANNVISSELKQAGHKLIYIPVPRDEEEIPVFDELKKIYDCVQKLIKKGFVFASSTIKSGGIAEAISKMSFGNKIGVSIAKDFSDNLLFEPNYGSFLLEVDQDLDIENYLSQISFSYVGDTIIEEEIQICNTRISIKEALECWQAPLEKIFPTKTAEKDVVCKERLFQASKPIAPSIKKACPKVFIPVFPGTNCEYDTGKAFERAGAEVSTIVFQNRNSAQIQESIEEMVKNISESQIIALAGGFSAGDEPDGSGKFIAAIFRNPRIMEAVMKLLKQRDGLMLGICNGFQALIKLGLVPYGEIISLSDESPTLTYNKIGRHISCMVQTKTVSTLSPWFQNTKLGEVHTVPVSHGEGRFVASDSLIQKLFQNGQVATQYVDFNGNISYETEFNPNGSYYGIEGITSPDGRVLGKMAHSERIGVNVGKNIIGNKDQKIFLSGVEYFTK